MSKKPTSDTPNVPVDLDAQEADIFALLSRGASSAPPPVAPDVDSGLKPSQNLADVHGQIGIPSALDALILEKAEEARLVRVQSQQVTDNAGSGSSSRAASGATDSKLTSSDSEDPIADFYEYEILQQEALNRSGGSTTQPSVQPPLQPRHKADDNGLENRSGALNANSENAFNPKAQVRLSKTLPHFLAAAAVVVMAVILVPQLSTNQHEQNPADFSSEVASASAPAMVPAPAPAPELSAQSASQSASVDSSSAASPQVATGASPQVYAEAPESPNSQPSTQPSQQPNQIRNDVSVADAQLAESVSAPTLPVSVLETDDADAVNEGPERESESEFGLDRGLKQEAADDSSRLNLAVDSEVDVVNTARSELGATEERAQIGPPKAIARSAPQTELAEADSDVTMSLADEISETENTSLNKKQSVNSPQEETVAVEASSIASKEESTVTSVAISVESSLAPLGRLQEGEGERISKSKVLKSNSSEQVLIDAEPVKITKAARKTTVISNSNATKPTVMNNTDALPGLGGQVDADKRSVVNVLKKSRQMAVEPAAPQIDDNQTDAPVDSKTDKPSVAKPPLIDERTDYRKTPERWKVEIIKLLTLQKNAAAKEEYDLFVKAHPDRPLTLELPWKQ